MRSTAIEGSGSSTLQKSTFYLAVTFFCVVIGAYAGLIGLGRWMLDEYFDFEVMREHPTYLLIRLKWSPRPLAEAIFSVYGWLVNHFHHPFIIPFLSLLWVIFLYSGLATAWQTRKQPGARFRLLLSFALVSVILAAGNTTEVFYWPAGAVAYLPTLAASLLLFHQTVSGRLDTRRGRTLAGICLIGAALSSECGALFALGYGALELTRRVRSRRLESHGRRLRSVVWFAFPSIIGLSVLLIVSLFRFGAGESLQLSASFHTHTAASSVLTSLAEMVAEAIGKQAILSGFRGDGSPLSMLNFFFSSRLPMELLLVLGIVFGQDSANLLSRESVSRMRVLVGSLLLSALFSIWAAETHFGAIGFERHECLRECWIVLCIAGLSLRSTNPHPPAKARAGRAIICHLALVAAVLSLSPVAPVWCSYQVYSTYLKIKRENYISGWNSGSSKMVYTNLPSAGVVYELAVQPGTYKTTQDWHPHPGTEGLQDFLLHYFNKQSITVLMPPKDQGMNRRR